jgi:hypothetical protein
LRRRARTPLGPGGAAGKLRRAARESPSMYLRCRQTLRVQSVNVAAVSIQIRQGGTLDLGFQRDCPRCSQLSDDAERRIGLGGSGAKGL